MVLSVLLQISSSWASPVTNWVQNLFCNAADAEDMSSIPASGKSPKQELETHSSILAWENSWTEEPGATIHGVTKEWAWLSN